ncbi:MAG: energy-coupling factor transporter transmembrane component T family protein [bacterium]
MSFLNDLTLGQYYPSNSILHRIDPRSKLLSSLILMTALLLADEISLVSLFGGVCVLGILFSKLPFKTILKNLRPFVWLFGFTFIIHLLTTPGRLLVQVPFLGASVTEAGVTNGIVFTLRLVFLIVLATLLTMTTSPIELTDGLERLFSPLKKLKVPVQEFTFMMTLSLRFVPILIREAERLKNAQLSRGVSLEGSLLRRVRNIVPMLLPLFISAFRRADELALAMEARHYFGGEGRTSFRRLQFKRADFVLLLLSAGSLASMVWLG